MKEILAEQEIYRQGSFKRVRQWLKGWHDGIRIWGWRGKETLVEKDIIKPIKEMKVERV